MNNRTATLGIGAAVIGVFTALVGAALAGKAPSKNAGNPGATGGEGASAGTDTLPFSETPPLVQPAAPGPVAASDGPSGPAATAQPSPTGDEGHAAPDLQAGADLGPDHRAPEAFRPNMDAPMTAAEREALRPAMGPSPSLVSDEGAGVQGTGGDLL